MADKLDPKEHGHTTLESLFKEWWDDYAAGKREDAHMVEMGSFKAILSGEKEAAPAGKEQDKGIGR